MLPASSGETSNSDPDSNDLATEVVGHRCEIGSSTDKEVGGNGFQQHNAEVWGALDVGVCGDSSEPWINGVDLGDVSEQEDAKLGSHVVSDVRDDETIQARKQSDTAVGAGHQVVHAVSSE